MEKTRRNEVSEDLSNTFDSRNAEKSERTEENETSEWVSVVIFVGYDITRGESRKRENDINIVFDTTPGWIVCAGDGSNLRG
jgi:hypothetical protein